MSGDTVRERIGIDIGKGYIKYAWRHGVGELQSLHSYGKLTSLATAKESASSNLSVNGTDFILGEFAPLGIGFNLRDDEKKADELNLAFVLSVLARLNVSHAEIMVGLPVSTMEKEKVDIKRLFNGAFDVDLAAGKEKVQIDIQPYVMAEPLGTYFSLICNEFGQVDTKSMYYAKQMVIVDIGYSTLDIVVAQKGNLSEKKKSDHFGVANIYKRIWKELEKEYGMVKANEQVEIMDVITRGDTKANLHVDGRIVDHRIWNKVKDWKMELAKTITESMKSVLGDLRPPITLATGGGALLLKEELSHFHPSFTIHMTPRFANAIGFYRGLLYFARKRGESVTAMAAQNT